MCPRRRITGSFTEAENLTVERVERVRGPTTRGGPIKTHPTGKKPALASILIVRLPFRLRRGALATCWMLSPWGEAKRGFFAAIIDGMGDIRPNFYLRAKV